MLLERDLQFQTPCQIVKTEKYEAFCVSRLLIWCQKWDTGPRHLLCGLSVVAK